MSRAIGEFEIASWDEDTYKELSGGRKLTRATVSQKFSGDIDGRGDVEWLMAYQHDGTARFVGLQSVEGSLEGRSGSFVVETIGDFDGRLARGSWTVVPGSATEGLAGLKGEGRFEAPKGPMATFLLDYSFG